MDISVSLSHLLIVLNSSLNFIIYCFKDYKFRRMFKSLLPGSMKSGSVRPSVRGTQEAIETLEVEEHEEWEMHDII